MRELSVFSPRTTAVIEPISSLGGRTEACPKLTERNAKAKPTKCGQEVLISFSHEAITASGTVMVAYSPRDRAVEGVGGMTTGPSGSDEVWT